MYKILFGKKYFNHDITTVPSGFLIWCIEEYEAADWLLINECKKELSARLKLEWIEPAPKNYPSKKELIESFKHRIADDLKRSGRSDETVSDICKGHVSWTPKNEENIGEVIVKFIAEIVKLKETIDWYKAILELHGINRGYFVLMGVPFTYSLLYKCKKNNAVRLPDEFYKTGNFGKSEFQLFTKD
ncbi:MAG: hypothetical protein ACHQ1D_00020 [Nitrososphaerales archaeon]